MADQNTSQPVRTETNGDIVAQLVDGTVLSQKLKIDAAGQPTVNQGVAAVASGAWPTTLTDGTNTTAVKPASTAAIATDPSAVVAMSPNSPLPAGTNLLGGATVYVGASAASVANPVPVSIVDSVAGSTQVMDYLDSAALAANASATHTYTVPVGHTLYLQQIMVTGSGKIKALIQWGPTGTETTKLVLFNSTATPNAKAVFQAPVSIATGGDVLITITNLDKQAADVYSTLEGYTI